MKKFRAWALVFAGMTAVCASAQDMIVKKDGTVIQAKVMKVGTSEVDYKKWSNQNGPQYSIAVADILAINYQNGEKETFDNVSAQPEASKPAAQPTGMTQVTVETLSAEANAANDAAIEKYNQIYDTDVNEVKKNGNAKRAFMRLGVTEGSVLENEDIERFEMMSPTVFFNDVDILANFGLCFKLFSICWLSNSKHALIWMGEHSNVNNLASKITKNSASDEDFLHFWQMEGTWYNFTEARMKALEKIFDQLGAKTKTQTAKKSSKKPAKKAEPKQDTVKISDVVTIKNDVAFIDAENDKFDHLMHLGGKNVDLYTDVKSELDASNQIDHVINAFKVAKKELDAFISELVKAKKAGATHVVDADWCAVKDFDFDN